MDDKTLKQVFDELKRDPRMMEIHVQREKDAFAYLSHQVKHDKDMEEVVDYLARATKIRFIDTEVDAIFNLYPHYKAAYILAEHFDDRFEALLQAVLKHLTGNLLLAYSLDEADTYAQLIKDRARDFGYEIVEGYGDIEI